MTGDTMEIPLAFDGHVARLVVTRLARGAWHVRTEVDGRVLGCEQFARAIEVDHFRARMQQWLAHAQAHEHRRPHGSAVAATRR